MLDVMSNVCPAVMPQAIGGSAGGDEAKLPETDFIRDDEQWLADAAAMTNDFLKTPAVDHLVQGRLGATQNPSVFVNRHQGKAFALPADCNVGKLPAL